MELSLQLIENQIYPLNVAQLTFIKDFTRSRSEKAE